MTALPGTPAIQNAIPMRSFGTTLFAAPILGILASAIILGFGLWWLRVTEVRARRAGEGYGFAAPANVDEQIIRERAANADNFDPAELTHGHRSEQLPSFAQSSAPILIVLVVNLVMSLVVLPRADTGFLAEPRFGERSLSAVSGVWSVVTALAIASLVLAVILRRRLPQLRKTLDAGANASRCRFSTLQVWLVSVRWWRLCRPSRWSETKCWRDARWPARVSIAWQPTCFRGASPAVLPAD